ncbi:hypothetical protein HY496_02375 [Candidatus Woesearchaeota archaeon]|nr:hypothetical protein [Candidatus Woesearchaeota archaeon]
MLVHFRVHVYDKEDIPEVRRYLEVYANDIATEKGKDTMFTAYCSSLTYQQLFNVQLTRTENGWQQQSECCVPMTLEDVVSKAEIDVEYRDE